MDAASPAHRVGGRLALSDPVVKKIAQASSSHNYFDELPKLQGEDDWHKWSDALQDAALMAGADAILNGESTHPLSLDDKQCTTAEWNDNIKRTAVWRRRNESLLKAMRDTMESDADIDMFGSLNAHKAYIGLKSRYYVSDNQKVINLYNDELLLAEIDLDDSPKEIADDFQAAFDQYNHLFDHNESQRLPENFLKLEFLNSLGIVYADWVRTLLKEHDVLGLDQGPTLTFNELVDLVIVESDRLSQAQKDVSAHTDASRQSAKRNISQVTDVSQPEPRAVCSLAHHQNFKHNNQTCPTQNPRLRPRNWQASLQDQEYLADHPEIEGHHSRNVCQNPGDYVRQEDSQEVGPSGKDTNNDIPKSSPMDDRDWGQLAASRLADVDAQRHEITRASSGKRSKNSRRTLELLSGEWLLYAQEYNPGGGGDHHIYFWETTTDGQKQLKTPVRQYQGRLVVGPYGHSETFEISTFTPNLRIKGRSVKMNCKTSNGRRYAGKATFWGNGMMVCTVPAPPLDATRSSCSMVTFSGVRLQAVAQTAARHCNDEESQSDGSGDNSGDDERLNGEDSEPDDDESDQLSDRSEASGSSAREGEEDDTELGVDDQEWRQFACARLSDVEAQKIAASDVIKDDPRAVHRGPFPGLWRLYSPRYNPGEDGCHYLKFWETTIQRDSRHRHYRGELSTGPCDDSTVRQIKQFSPSNKVKGSVLELITATENVILGTMTLWGKGKMYATIHSSHLCGYNGGPGWIKFAGIWNEAGEHLPWREVEKLIERKRANNVAASRKDIHQGAGEERYDLVVRAEKNTAVVVKTEDEDTSMAEDEEDETSVIIKTEDADSSSDDSHDEWTDDVATTDRAVRTQEHAVRQGLVSLLHTLSGKWYFHSPDHNPGLDKDISITFYDRQALDVSERMCAPGHCKSTPAQIHYCGELRFKAPNGERDFHCFIKQFDVPKQTSLIPVIIELWELHNKRAIFVNAWFLGAGTMRMAIPTTYIPSYQGKKTMITFSGVKYGWASPAG
ncbi:hypothetical protein D6D12_01012 [Aureobasidium pullulans]|uniref:Uncharacterized protein n=1 Tax=Aureobasidium pullulans TaxID=5580 RepID=A0AB74K5N3_AURPU|nr:hypothetical protein D6D12_01012 [Aureobasidium pullulans]THX45860.1 hypothetical protein D6D11_07153 [Aureobasidium pullulans]